MSEFKTFDVNLLCGAGGAEISGVNAAATLGAETVN